MTDTIIMGEASESESEDISINDCSDDDECPPNTFDSNLSKSNQNISSQETKSSAIPQLLTSLNYKSIFSVFESSTSLFIGSKTSNSIDVNVKKQSVKQPESSPIFKNLEEKNVQLFNNLVFLKHLPYLKASKDLNTISQKLVTSQKIVHEIDDAMQRLKRECSNFNSLRTLDKN